MPVIDRRGWQDPGAMVEDPDEVSAILRNSLFATGQILPYLEQLEQKHGIALPHLQAMARYSFVFLSGEEHLQLRRLIAPFFSPRMVERWLPDIDRSIAAALERLSGASTPDVMLDYVEPAFVQLIRAFVGFEGGRDEDVVEAIRVANDATQPMLSLAALRRIDSAMAMLTEHLADAYADRRGLLGFLSSHEDNPEVHVNVALSTLIAGHTMAQTLSFLVYGLLLGPSDDWSSVTAPDWPEARVERALSRYLSTLTLVRLAPETQATDGCPFHSGQTVVLDVVAANARLRSRCRDDDAPQLLSFGAGVHKCPGETLSRLFIARAAPALAHAYPALSLHRESVRFNVTPIVQYPTRLPCTLEARDRRLTARLVEIGREATARQVVNDERRWGPPTMVDHLEALETRTGTSLRSSKCLARNALFFLSGGRHAKLRRTVMDCLGGNRLVRWQLVIDAAVRDALVTLERSPKPDLVADYADPIFTGVMKPVLGIETSDDARFDALAPLIQDVLQPLLPLRELVRTEETLDELLHLMRVPQPAPDASPLPLLATLNRTHPLDLAEDDTKALALVLYGASFNTRHTLANILHHVLSMPSEKRSEAHMPRWTNTRLETLIALCAAPKYIYRMAREESVLGGMTLRRDDTLRLSLLTLNRGGGSGHLAFGHGLHRCVGAALAKRVLKAAVPALFARHRGLALEPQRHRYHPMSQTVALASLPCRLSKRMENDVHDRR
ncbi:MAG: hypothetical protein CMM50_18215 [Rhodospirillaceae bacterium]|nr:hypothetical protein [Rhodospirillaceae bacterium]